MLKGPLKRTTDRPSQRHRPERDRPGCAPLEAAANACSCGAWASPLLSTPDSGDVGSGLAWAGQPDRRQLQVGRVRRSGGLRSVTSLDLRYLGLLCNPRGTNRLSCSRRCVSGHAAGRSLPFLSEPGRIGQPELARCLAAIDLPGRWAQKNHAAASLGEQRPDPKVKQRPRVGSRAVRGSGLCAEWASLVAYRPLFGGRADAPRRAGCRKDGCLHAQRSRPSPTP